MLHHGRMICNRKGTHLTVLPEKEWLSANTMQEGTRLFGTLPFLLYIVLQVALFVFGAILKKWTAKSERWYNNKKRRETHGKHQVYRGIQAKHSKLV